MKRARNCTLMTKVGLFSERSSLCQIFKPDHRINGLKLFNWNKTLSEE
jgi:hypothetical protein